MATHQCPVPVGPGEMALMLGLTRQRVDQLSRERQFPEPWAELRTGRIWREQDVVDWAVVAGRTVRDWRAIDG